FTLFVRQHCPRVRVYAVEPIPQVFERLRLNATLYGGQVELVEQALGREAGQATFTYYPHVSIVSGRYADAAAEREVSKACLLTQREGGGREGGISDAAVEEMLAERLHQEEVSCQVRPLSQVVQEYGVEQIDLLKIDVEKSEWEVLAGIAAEDWPKIRQIVVEVHDLEDRLARVTGLLYARGHTVSVDQEAALADRSLYTV